MGILSQSVGGLVAWPVGYLSDGHILGRKGPIFFACTLMTASYLLLVALPHYVKAQGDYFRYHLLSSNRTIFSVSKKLKFPALISGRYYRNIFNQ